MPSFPVRWATGLAGQNIYSARSPRQLWGPDNWPRDKPALWGDRWPLHLRTPPHLPVPHECQSSVRKFSLVALPSAPDARGYQDMTSRSHLFCRLSNRTAPGFPGTLWDIPAPMSVQSFPRWRLLRCTRQSAPRVADNSLDPDVCCARTIQSAPARVDSRHTRRTKETPPSRKLPAQAPLG